MSGHSHWSGIKHKKGLTDAKRSKMFTKAARLITISAKQGGPDPDSNPSLRLAIEKAREVNMPKVNIERAIDKATGKGSEKVNMEAVSYEAFGPGGVAMIIQGITDNKNRAVANVRKIVTKSGGRMAEAGSVSWMFKQKGKMKIAKTALSGEELELALIDCGVDDIIKRNMNPAFAPMELRTGKQEIQITETIIYYPPELTQSIQKSLSEKNIETSQAEIELVPKQTIEINKEATEKTERLLEELDDCDDVAEVFCNF